VQVPFLHPVEMTYRKSPVGAVVSLVLALLYGASPIDLLPDLLPLIGVVDDAVIVPVLLLMAWNLYRKRRVMKFSRPR
jgi:uncharacterized membrane protein YkvA (DUF1232 family)